MHPQLRFMLQATGIGPVVDEFESDKDSTMSRDKYERLFTMVGKIAHAGNQHFDDETMEQVCRVIRVTCEAGLSAVHDNALLVKTIEELKAENAQLRKTMEMISNGIDPTKTA